MVAALIALVHSDSERAQVRASLLAALPQTGPWGLGGLIEALVARLCDQGSPGVHLGMSAVNQRAYGFYRTLGFEELSRRGTGTSASIYMGRRLASCSGT